MTNDALLLKGERVALREMTQDDQHVFRAWLDDPELRMLIADPTPPSAERQSAWFARSREADRNIMSIVTVPDGALIGNGGFTQIDPEKGTALFRITIGDPAARGKGFGTEATMLLLRYAFVHMKLSTVSLNVFKDNERAVRLYEKVGFKKTGGEIKDGKEKVSMRIDASAFIAS